MLIERHDKAHLDAPSRRLYTQTELDEAVAAERERWQSQCAGKRHDGCAHVAICGSVCNKCGRVA